VQPGDADEVAAVVRACAEAGAPIVPQGGNTGLVGGGVPRGGEVLLSLRRLTVIEELDETAGQVTVGAGLTLEALQEHLRGSNLAFAVDHAARGAATLGGMVATNAGGVHVLRYGAMREQVAGLEAVLADGAVVRRLSGVLKDNAGYELPGLIVGSEGTLAIVTRARLRLVNRLPERVVALFGVDDTAGALELFRHLRRRVGSLEAVEIFYADGLELVCEHLRISPPFDRSHPVFVLVECAAAVNPLEELAAAADVELVRDVAAADDTARRADLWRYREGHAEAINSQGVPHKLDVSVPLSALPVFERDVRERVCALAPGARTILFGHLGDGNIHVNVLGLEPEDERVDEAVLRLAAAYGGSVSAEHGIGVAKRRWLSLTRSREEVAAMVAIKRALDPNGILNPGALLP
jgi:FAD/FMN-containing dehydrogenase